MATQPRRRITADDVRRVHELKAEQPSMSQADIGKLFDPPLAAGTVNGILKRSPDVQPSVVATPPAETETAGETDPTAERRESLKSLRGARRIAEANKDPIRIIQAALGAAKVAGDIERSNPRATNGLNPR
jgi:hypothetical protein